MTHEQKIAAALQQFHPTNFGLVARENVPQPEEERAWVTDLPGVGQVGLMTLSWAHANGNTQWTDANGESRSVSFMELVSRLQGQVWGMGDFDVLPPIGLAKVEESGGCLGVAYLVEKGFTSEGWLGFVLGFGSPGGVLYSHMLATNPTARNHNIGWLLKVVQGYHALREGHTVMRWTFDPMRGANATLNVVKLGGVLDIYVEDYYGGWHNGLYGRVPTDRYKVRWSLTEPTVHERLKNIYAGQHPPTNLASLENLPSATVQTIDTLLAERPPQLVFAIPGDIDSLAATDLAQALKLRVDMRAVLTRLLDTRRPEYAVPESNDPAYLGVENTKGQYEVTDFVSALRDGVRRNFYVLTRKF